MPTIVTVTQRFPTWAAANETRDQLAGNGGFDRYGIERIDIERLGAEFELRIRTVEFHRDHIEHLLRSSGTMFNLPAAARPWAQTDVARSLLYFGAAAVAGACLYALFGRRNGGSHRQETWRTEQLPRGESRDDSLNWQRKRFESDRQAGLRSHAEGFAI